MKVLETREQAAAAIRVTDDPVTARQDTQNASPKLKCKDVFNVFEPDEDGITEVNYVDFQQNALTAYFKGTVFQWCGEGW